MGVGSVALLYATVKRWFSPGAALLAGAGPGHHAGRRADVPVQQPRRLLVLLLCGAAYAVTRALEQAPRWRWLTFAGSLVGFAFLAKMLQAFLVAPGVRLAYLIAAPTSFWKRIGHLTPWASRWSCRPAWWIADRPALARREPARTSAARRTTAFWNCVFGYNGLGRLTGKETGSRGRHRGQRRGGQWGPTGPFRMFNSSFGGQVSWLLPAALLLLVAGLVWTLREPRTDRSRAAPDHVGRVAARHRHSCSASSGGIIHQYYTVALAPAIGAPGGHRRLDGMGPPEADRRPGRPGRDGGGDGGLDRRAGRPHTGLEPLADTRVGGAHRGRRRAGGAGRPGPSLAVTATAVGVVNGTAALHADPSAPKVVSHEPAGTPPMALPGAQPHGGAPSAYQPQSLAHDHHGPVAHDPAPLTSEDLSALNNYTGLGHEDLNDALRNETVDASQQARVDALNRALDKLPPYEGPAVRGTDLPPDVLAQYQPGAVVTEPAFFSSSTNPAVPQSTAFAGNVEFRVLSRTGRDISSFSMFPTEQEVLFPTGVTFYVLDRRSDPLTGITIIEMIEQ